MVNYTKCLILLAKDLNNARVSLAEALKYNWEAFLIFLRPKKLTKSSGMPWETKKV